jgi:hypothetical protein
MLEILLNPEYISVSEETTPIELINSKGLFHIKEPVVPIAGAELGATLGANMLRTCKIFVSIVTLAPDISTKLIRIIKRNMYSACLRNCCSNCSQAAGRMA